jgi:hypothetical protein
MLPMQRFFTREVSNLQWYEIWMPAGYRRQEGKRKPPSGQRGHSFCATMSILKLLDFHEIGSSLGSFLEPPKTSIFVYALCHHAGDNLIYTSYLYPRWMTASRSPVRYPALVTPYCEWLRVSTYLLSVLLEYMSQ